MGHWVIFGKGGTVVLYRISSNMASSDSNTPIIHQINLITQAMKEQGVWSHSTPDWIYQHQDASFPDVWQWLQFVYLPMRLHSRFTLPHYVAPILSPYLDTTPHLAHILPLLIELDALSPTIKK